MPFYRCTNGSSQGGGGYTNFPLIQGKIGKTTTPYGYNPDGYPINGTNHQITLTSGSYIDGPFYSLLFDTSQLGPYDAILLVCGTGQSIYLVASQFDESTGSWSDIVSPSWMTRDESRTINLPQNKLVQLSFSAGGTARLTWMLTTR